MCSKILNFVNLKHWKTSSKESYFKNPHNFLTFTADSQMFKIGNKPETSPFKTYSRGVSSTLETKTSNGEKPR